MSTIDPTDFIVVFDVGDTLFHKPSKIKIAVSVLQEFGLSLLNPSKAWRIYSLYKKAKTEAKTEKNCSWDQVFANKYAFKELGCNSEEFLKGITKIALKTVNPIPEMMNIVYQLHKRHVSLAILSNTDYAIGIAMRQKLSNLFNPIVLSCDRGNVSKPKLESFKTLLNKVNRSAAEVIFFDNSRTNVEAARKVGIQAFHYKNPLQVRQQLELLGILSDHR